MNSGGEGPAGRTTEPALGVADGARVLAFACSHCAAEQAASYDEIGAHKTCTACQKPIVIPLPRIGLSRNKRVSAADAPRLADPVSAGPARPLPASDVPEQSLPKPQAAADSATAPNAPDGGGRSKAQRPLPRATTEPGAVRGFLAGANFKKLGPAASLLGGLAIGAVAYTLWSGGVALPEVSLLIPELGASAETEDNVYARFELILRRFEIAASTSASIKDLIATRDDPELPAESPLRGQIDSRLAELNSDLEKDRLAAEQAFAELVEARAKSKKAYASTFEQAVAQATQSASYETLEILNTVNTLIENQEEAADADLAEFAAFWESRFGG